ncbi:hypothetical protein RchiOBHm_Chr2g0149431 [Rosa chinensis]|uniref:Uncharacterized protein n=1 Tax=Rosa chinensis TaxID=74649 RepID=A0A2P6RZQ6_ROSCH|nr:hypothetical protein RchiOBHm_Chr2g0149431 [Rosa chinensis]
MMALLLLSIAHLAQAADSTAAARAELDFLSIAWSILILMTLAVGLVAFGGVLIYCLDLLSYMTLFRTGVYDIIHGLVCERMGFDERFVGMAVYSPISMLFKHIGRPFRYVIHSLLGSQLAEYWIILWQLQCQVYKAVCMRFISVEHDSFLLILIKIVTCLLGVLGGRRFGLHWWWMSWVGSQLHILLIGLFHLWLRLGTYLR